MGSGVTLAPRDAEETELMKRPEVRAHIEQLQRRHYENWRLGGKTEEDVRLRTLLFGKGSRARQMRQAPGEKSDRFTKRGQCAAPAFYITEGERTVCSNCTQQSDPHAHRPPVGAAVRKE